MNASNIKFFPMLTEGNEAIESRVEKAPGTKAVQLIMACYGVDIVKAQEDIVLDIADWRDMVLDALHREPSISLPSSCIILFSHFLVFKSRSRLGATYVCSNSGSAHTLHSQYQASDTFYFRLVASDSLCPYATTLMW
jgi:hypothetical protein